MVGGGKKVKPRPAGLRLARKSGGVPRGDKIQVGNCLEMVLSGHPHSRVEPLEKKHILKTWPPGLFFPQGDKEQQWGERNWRPRNLNKKNRWTKTSPHSFRSVVGQVYQKGNKHRPPYPPFYPLGPSGYVAKGVFFRAAKGGAVRKRSHQLLGIPDIKKTSSNGWKEKKKNRETNRPLQTGDQQLEEKVHSNDSTPEETKSPDQT